MRVPPAHPGWRPPGNRFSLRAPGSAPVPVPTDDAVQHFGGLGLVPADGFQLGCWQPGRQSPRIAFPPAVNLSEPVEHLAVTTHDPFPGHHTELAGGTDADLGDYLRGKQ